jgi:ubiquinone/menaquinone biosynthesis C-methylase UbiE
MQDVSKLYEKRFEGDLRKRNEIWKVLCESFFQRYVGEKDVVLDVGAGYCEFINNIRCGKKYAVDLNEDTKRAANADVTVFASSSIDMPSLESSLVDVVFMSNFIEHLKTRDDVLTTLHEIYRILRPGGRILVLQPNIRYAYKEYWDYFDHYVPLSDRSLTEALQLTGFEIEEVIPRFLPYTMKSRMPQYNFLVRAYLKLPFAWKALGKQAFVVARKAIVDTD